MRWFKGNRIVDGGGKLSMDDIDRILYPENYRPKKRLNKLGHCICAPWLPRYSMCPLCGKVPNK